MYRVRVSHQFGVFGGWADFNQSAQSELISQRQTEGRVADDSRMNLSL